MLVGSIGLVLSVPVTTWLAAAVLSKIDDVSDLDDSRGQDHGHTRARSAPVTSVPDEHHDSDDHGPGADGRPVRPWF
jgi:hypothetical protein